MTAITSGKNLACERHGRGVPLMLVHGFPLDRTIWHPLLPHLAGAFDVVLPDLPGFGASPDPAPSPTVEAYAAALAGLLDELGLGQVCLAGHSMGGYVCLAFARLFPQRLLGLGLVASQALDDSPERKAGRYQTAAQVQEQGVRVVADAMAPKLSADPAHVPMLHGLILGQRVPGVVAGLHLMAGRPDSSASLPAFEFPVVLVHGQADALIPPERSREVASAVARGHLFELPGVGHMPMLEAPQQTAKALLHLIFDPDYLPRSYFTSIIYKYNNEERAPFGDPLSSL